MAEGKKDGRGGAGRGQGRKPKLHVWDRLSIGNSVTEVKRLLLERMARRAYERSDAVQKLRITQRNFRAWFRVGPDGRRLPLGAEEEIRDAQRDVTDALAGFDPSLDENVAACPVPFMMSPERLKALFGSDATFEVAVSGFSSVPVVGKLPHGDRYRPHRIAAWLHRRRTGIDLTKQLRLIERCRVEWQEFDRCRKADLPAIF